MWYGVTCVAGSMAKVRYTLVALALVGGLAGRPLGWMSRAMA